MAAEGLRVYSIMDGLMTTLESATGEEFWVLSGHSHVAWEGPPRRLRLDRGAGTDQTDDGPRVGDACAMFQSALRNVTPIQSLQYSTS